MEFECARHPGASTLSSRLLDKTAGKSWQPSHEPPRRRDNGHPSYWHSIYGGNKGRKWLKQQPRYYARTQNSATTNTKDSRARGQQRTADSRGLPILAQSMHCRRCTNEHSKMQGTHAIAQVPHKTLLGMREHWHRSTIVQTIYGLSIQSRLDTSRFDTNWSRFETSSKSIRYM